MNLNYQEIMELPEPRDGADVGTMESICGVYAQLVRKLTRMLEEARQIKVCWMQEERVALYAKRLAANQREYACIDKQRRAGEMFNFCLRVREWVLSNPERRLKIRSLIGEARIAKWQDKKLIWDAKSQLQTTPNTNRNKFRASQASPYRAPPPDYNGRNTKRQEVGDWYRLPYFHKRANPNRLKLPRIDKSHLSMRHLNMDHLPKAQLGIGKQSAGKQSSAAKGGMCRAVPTVVFWPDELALDYVHEKVQIIPKKPVGECPVRMVAAEEHQAKVRACPSPTSYMEAPTAKEWPD